MRRAREIRSLIEEKNLNPENLKTDEEMQKLMHEIILEECANEYENGSDSDFVKDINELQNSKITLLKKNFELNFENEIYVTSMMKNIIGRVVENQNRL